MPAMQLLQCTITLPAFILRIGRTNEGNPMGFFTELFTRPRPRADNRCRAALATLEAMSHAERADIGIKPVDFPRIAREMSLR